MIDSARIQKLAQWLKNREKIHELAIAWPPAARVTSHEDHPLMFPAPGIVGYVASYYEDGTVGVLAPAQEAITSPITGATVRHHEMINGQCDPALLVLLEYGEFEPDDVRAAIEIAVTL